MAAEAASFSTVIDSMSWAAMLRMSPPGTPSITISGLLEADSDVAPRICRFELEFGLAPAVVLTVRPATLPVSISIGLFMLPLKNWSLLTWTIELDSSFLLSEP